MKRNKLGSRKASKEGFSAETRSVVVNFLGLIPSNDGPLASSQTSSGSFVEQLRGLGSPEQAPLLSLGASENSFDLEASEGQPSRSRVAVGATENAVFRSADLPLVPLVEGTSRPDSLQVAHWSTHTTDVGHGSLQDLMEPPPSQPLLLGDSSGTAPRHSTPIQNGAMQPQQAPNALNNDVLSNTPRSQSASPPICTNYTDNVDLIQESGPRETHTTDQEQEQHRSAWGESGLLNVETPTDARSETHTLSEGTHGDSMSMSESYTLSGGHTPADTSTVEANDSVSDSSRDTIDVDQLDTLPRHLCGPADLSRMAASQQRQPSSGGKMDPIPENRMMKSAMVVDRQLSRTSDESDLSLQAASRSSRASSRVSVFEISQDDLKMLVRSHTLPSTALSLQHALSEELVEHRRPAGEEAEEENFHSMQMDGACDSGPTPSPMSSGRVSPETEVARQLGIIGDAIQERYSRSLNTAVVQLCQLAHGDLTYERVSAVAREAGILLEDVHSWRQVVLWLVFSQRLAFGLLQQGEQHIRQLIDLTTKVLEDKMAAFIINQGGWASIQDLEVGSPVSVSDISPRFPDVPTMADAAPGNPQSGPDTGASAAATVVVNGEHMDHGDNKAALPKTPPKVAPKPPPRLQVAPNPPSTDSNTKATAAKVEKVPPPATPPAQSVPPPVPPRVNVQDKAPAENPAQSTPVTSTPAEKAPEPAAASQVTPPPASEEKSANLAGNAAAAAERSGSPAQGAEPADDAEVPVDVEKIRPEINMMRQISEQFDEDSGNHQEKYSMARLALCVGAAALAGAFLIFLVRKRK